MASVTAKKSKGPVIDPALCRCCHSIKRCRLLTSEYEFMGSKEVYSDMFMDVFGLLLSHLDGHDTECCICATCVSRLREASEFRRQVLQSEQMFLQARLTDDDKQMKLEVKEEPVCDSEPRDDDAAADHDDDSEMDSLMNKPTAVSDVNSSKEKLSKRSRNGHKTKVRDLRAGKVQRLHRKLDKLLKPETPAVESHTKKRAEAMDRHRMALSNTVAIVTHSYACPFHNRISFYYCFYCRDQFTDPAELRAHTLTHDPKLFESSIENKKIPKIDITRIDCRLCTDTIDDLDTFKRHVTERHQKVLYPVENEFLKFRLTLNKLACTECNAVFPFFDSLKKHMIEHFGTHTCDVCGACFLEPASLRTHLKTHTKVDANYPCSVCGKNLKSKYSMGLHVATVHEKKPTVNCYKCDAAFLSYALRNRHLIEAHGDARTFPCELCDKVYNRRKTLIEHHRRNHLKVFNHRCELCDQRFYLPSRLREHMATHTGERGFRCELCDKTYPRLQALHEHARCHADDALRSAPKTHAKTAHGAFRPDADFSH